MSTGRKEKKRCVSRFLSLMVMLCFVLITSTACDWLKDDDDNSSDAGAGSAPAPQTTQPQPVTEATAASANQETTASGGSATATTGDTSTTSTTPSVTETYPSLAGTGIVWKPVSEADHNLVVLLPTSYGNAGAVVLDANKRVLESGRYIGATNGDRATYRFSRPGGAFPVPCLLQVGSSLFSVAHPDSRYN